MKKCLATCDDHAGTETLLEAAVLAPVALLFVNFAVSTTDARIHTPVLHCALEKALTSKKKRIKS